MLETNRKQWREKLHIKQRVGGKMTGQIELAGREKTHPNQSSRRVCGSDTPRDDEVGRKSLRSRLEILWPLPVAYYARIR